MALKRGFLILATYARLPVAQQGGFAAHVQDAVSLLPAFRGAGDGVERLWGATGTVFGPGFGVVRDGRQTYFAMLDFSLSGIHDRLSIP